MLVAFVIGIVAAAGSESSGDHLELHELIARADLCAAGVITRVHATTIEVEIEELGFGDPRGPTITVARFRSPQRAKRWNTSEDAVGERCLYFLDAPVVGSWHSILGTNGEGEKPLNVDRSVRLWRSGAAPPSGWSSVQVTELLEESRRYRRMFRLAEGGQWIEPCSGDEESDEEGAEGLEAYARSSPLAADLCAATYAHTWFEDEYRDPAARSPRPAEATPRVDLGIGALPRALAVLPDLDGDGGSEIACARRGSLELLRLDAAGNLRTRSWVRRADWEGLTSLASLGDLDGDGTQELAAGDAYARSGGLVRIVSLSASGEIARARRIDPAGRVFEGLKRPERFGLGLANLGDLDGDGTLELAVSAGANSGQVWIVSLDTAGTASRPRCVFEMGGSGIVPLALAALGDLDGDGTGDLALDVRQRPEDDAEHALLLLFLERDGRVREHCGLVRDVRWGMSFTSAVAPAGDWNGDGIPDLAVGAPESALRVLLLARDGRVQGEIALSPDGPALPEGADFGGALVCLARVGGGTRLQCAGLGEIERREKSSRYLRCYPSLWAFDSGSSSARQGR